MKKICFSLFLLAFIPTAVIAAPHGFCRKGYHEDSAGRGIEAGFKSQNLRPNNVDEVCYQEGVQEGSLLPKEDPLCQEDFAAGKANGLNVNSTTLGTTCSAKGYIAGVALLHVAAREGNSSLVGENCVSEYQRGIKDGNANSPPETSTDNVAAECYMTGFYDASPSQN